MQTTQDLYPARRRTDYDLTQHQNVSGQDLTYFDDEKKQKYIPSEWEKEFHICGSLAVEAQLFLIMVTVTNLIILKSESTQPVKAELLPVCKPLKICIRLAEEQIMT